MIIFHTLRFKNFLASGNVFTELKLDAYQSTLIVGKNGGGKSTMIDGICFALFGKPFRNINKSQLVNSINRKDCMVELEFSIGKKQYLVRRGIKPNVFEIFADEVLLDQTAAMKDQQDVLENNILKLNYKSFTQIVILGSAAFIPFMQLPAGVRREIIEDVLDIKIFSSMKDVAQKRLAILKINIDNLENELKLTLQKAKIQDSYIKTLENDQTTRIQELEERIADEETEIRLINTYLAVAQEDKQLLDTQVEVGKREIKTKSDGKKKELEHVISVKKNRLQESLAEEKVKTSSVISDFNVNMNNEIIDINKQIRKLLLDVQLLGVDKSEHQLSVRQLEQAGKDCIAEQEFYIENDTCDTCKQNIDATFKTEYLGKLEQQIKESTKEIHQHHLAIKKITEEIEESKKTESGLRTDVLEITARYEKDIQDFKGESDYKMEQIVIAGETSITEFQTQLTDHIESVNVKIQEFVDSMQGQVDAMKTEISEHKANIQAKEKSITQWNQEKNSLNSNTGNIDEERGKLKSMAKEMKLLGEQKTTMHEDRHYLDIALSLLKDSGIKTTVVDKYLPAINTLINKYLKEMDLFVEFTLDKEFNEVIKSRFRDEFSYANFSEGEKQRIDLSITLVFRDIAKMKNSTNTNLFILDEVFDSSLDEAGTDYLANLLNNLGEKQNVWVISHKGDQLMDKFSRTLKFVNQNNFSILEEV